MRSPVAMSNGCAPVLASYSAITRLTSSMSAVAGSYSRIVVSPWDENVTILAFMLWSPVGLHLASCGLEAGGLGSLPPYCTDFQRCQDCIWPAITQVTFRPMEDFVFFLSRLGLWIKEGLE